MKRILRNIALMIGWLLVGVAALLVLAAVFIQTRPAKNIIVRMAENQVADFVDGEVVIGKIDGNFFSELSLENVLWKNRADTVAFVESVYLSYRLLPLLHRELWLQSVKITHPYFNLKQEKDSTWNIQHLVAADNAKSEDKTKASGDFRVIVSDFTLQKGKLGVQALDTFMPDEVVDLDINLMIDYAANKQLLQLKKLAFQTRKPEFRLVQLSFKVLSDATAISLNDFYIKTAQNSLNGKATYSDRRTPDITAELESKPFDLNEFEFFMPGIYLPVKPALNLSAKTANGELEASVSLVDQDQKIQLYLFSENFSDFVSNPQNTRLEYRLSGVMEKISLAHWLGHEQLNYLLNGKFKVNGGGTDAQKANVVFDADFNNCLLDAKPVEELKMSFHLANGNLSGSMAGKGNFGEVSLTAEINSLLENPTYHFQTLTQKLNLAPLLGNDSLQSAINLRAEIAGKGFDSEVLTAQAEIALGKSSIVGYVVDSLSGSVRYAQKNIEIDALRAKAQASQININGNYNFEGNSDLSIEAEVDSMQPFWKYIPLDSISGQGKLSARLQGTPDSLFLESNVELANIIFSDLSAEKITVNGSGKLTPGDTLFSADAHLVKLRAAGFVIDSVSATTAYLPDSLSAGVDVFGEQLRSNLRAQVLLGNTIKIRLSEFAVDYLNEHLELAQAPAVLEIDSATYRLSDFKMASENSDTAQFIKAEGIFSMNGDEDFSLEIANANVAQLLESVGQKKDVSGRLNMNAKLNGTAQFPELTGNFSVDHAMAYGYRFSELGGEYGLHNNRLQLKGQVAPIDSGKFVLTASIPVAARFDSLAFAVNQKDSINAALQVSSFPLAALQFFNPGDQVTGVLSGKVNVAGTLESPDTKGDLQLLDASVVMPEYGIYYRDIVFDLNFSKDAARLDSFYIKSPDGTLKASGTIDFNSAFYRGDISQSEVSIHFNRFNPFNHRQFNMQLSGDASLKGKAGEVVFDGQLKVLQAEIYLPAVMSLMGRMVTPETPEPILMREMNKLSQPADSQLLTRHDTTRYVKDTFNLNYLDNFTGKLNIQFPQNTWIKNKDLFVEVSGDLDVMKNNEFFELFGTIDIVRGQYDLLGKTFKIDQGTIAFQGGEEMMPVLNITASSTFRNTDRAEQKLSVAISGKATEPAIEFSLDGSRISEGDALSYIVFGKGMNELTIDQQENVSGAGQLAGSAAMALLSSQLTDLLGNSLNVDYIEVKGNGDFDNATVVVGKYITNDLFVSYEQRFGEPDEKDMAKYEVKLEYELFRFLFLQLNNSSTDSGFDLIFKLNSKQTSTGY